jgi:hypothetical protein
VRTIGIIVFAGIIACRSAWAETPTMTVTSTPTRLGTYTPKGTATPTRTATSTWTANATPTWTPRWAGYYACRGGVSQGEVCGLDAQCPGLRVPPSTPAICTWGGHPHICMNAPKCMLTGDPCTDNLDCPGWAAVTPTPANYCPSNNGLDLPRRDCTQDSDCGLCVGGTTPGWSCTNSTQCSGGGTCDLSGGQCIKGYQQGQDEVYPQGSGAGGDPYVDYCLLNQTCESDQNGAVNSTTARYAVGLRYFPELAKLVHFMSSINTVRIQGWDAASALIDNAPISWFLGATDINHGLWQNIPGDNTIYGNMSPNSLNNSGGFIEGFAYDPVTDSLWASDVDNVREYSASPHSKDLPNRILGYTDFTGYSRLGLVCHGGSNDGTSCNPDLNCSGGTCVPDASGVYTCQGGSNDGDSCSVDASCTGGGTCNHGYLAGAAGIAAMKRCNGSTSFGTPCLVDGDCSDGTCTTTLLVVEMFNNDVAGWKDISTALSGAIPDFYLGQIDGLQGSCNHNLSAPTAATLCSPSDVAFDTSGNIYVSDTGNVRVLGYPTASQTGASATVVFGAGDFTHCGTLFAGGCGGGGQKGITVDPVTGALSVADTYNNRVLTFAAPFTSPVTAPTYCIGQPDCSTTWSGQSSDGTKLDRLYNPSAVSSDGNGGLYVGDSANNRDLHFPAPLATNKQADLLLGQTSATVTEQINAHVESGFNWGGICFYSANGMTGVCKVSQSHNRALCWNDWTTFGHRGVAPETDADAVLGQVDGTGGVANAGGLSANSLNGPMGCAADAGHLYIADAGNNRITRYTFGSPEALTTHQAADLCYGQADCTHNSSGLSATALSYPTDVQVDGHGNLWIVDQGNYRVLVACMSPGTLGTVCTSGNSGDSTWDLVFGQADFTHAVPACSSAPAANRFCLPWSVIPDVVIGNQVLVSDAADNDAARIQIFGGPWSSGMDASSTLGQLSTASFAAYSGVCVNGTNAGNACSETGDEYLQGGTSVACPGGYCSYGIIALRSASSPISMALTSLHSPRSLWVTRREGMVRWLEPFTTGKLAGLKTASNTNHAFDFWGSGYVESQPDHTGGGIAEAPDYSIWFAQGGGNEAIAAIYAMFDPEGTLTAPPTVTPAATPTPTAPPTNTSTPTQTSTPTPTSAFTVTPVATITPTPPPTVPPTSTPTPCVGDCNSDGHVTVDEILTMVNIALGNSAVTTCQAGDANHDGHITVDELLTAVNNALTGCERNGGNPGG